MLWRNNKINATSIDKQIYQFKSLWIRISLQDPKYLLKSYYTLLVIVSDFFYLLFVILLPMKKSFHSLRKLYADRTTFLHQASQMTFGRVFYKFWMISVLALLIRWAIGLIFFVVVSTNVSKEQIMSGSALVVNNIASALPSDYVLQYEETKGFSSNQSGPVHLTYSQIFSGVIQNDAIEIDDEDMEFSKYKYVITIDTNPDVSITDLAKDSLVSITATQWAINQNRRGETRVFDIVGPSNKIADESMDKTNNEIPSLTLTPQKISQERSPALWVFVDEYRSTFRSRVYVIAIIGWIIGLLIASLIIALFQSVLMFLYALIIYFIGMMSKQDRSYNTSYGMISLAYFVPFVLFWIVGVQGLLALVIALVVRAIVMFAKPQHSK